VLLCQSTFTETRNIEKDMVMQATYGNGVIENPTIEISQDGLRSILAQIEAELVDSEVYRRTMAGLQTMLGEASSTAQILVKAVGREAVRLTFQQLVRQYNIVPVSSETTKEVRQEQSNFSQRVDDTPQRVESLSEEEFTQPDGTTKLSNVTNKQTANTKQTQKLRKAELAAQKAAKEREEILLQIGQALLQARQDRSISVYQLHTQTLVPMHHIEALETGRLNELPEDVYIRGFIRRIGNALGLNGVAMAASLPEPDPVKSVVPSWYNNSTAMPGFQLNSVHLYLGYTALIAGAIGGLGLMSKQATPNVSVELEPIPTPSSETSASPKAERKEASSKPGLKASKTGIKAGADIAPPEALPF
jgi:cytoskeleton protein RodZ